MAINIVDLLHNQKQTRGPGSQWPRSATTALPRVGPRDLPRRVPRASDASPLSSPSSSPPPPPIVPFPRRSLGRT